MQKRKGSTKVIRKKYRSDKYGDVYVAGDSIVRYQKQNLKNRLGNAAGVGGLCIPGGKINHISNAIEDLGNYRNVVISVGTNEIGKPLGYIGIVEKYTELFGKLRSKNSEVVIVGILPRLRESGLWASRAIAINNWLQQQCILFGFTYVDLWEVMYENRYYFNRDGIHWNFRGREFLS